MFADDVPPEVYLAATEPICDVELSEAEEDRIHAVVHATWEASQAMLTRLWGKEN